MPYQSVLYLDYNSQHDMLVHMYHGKVSGLVIHRSDTFAHIRSPPTPTHTQAAPRWLQTNTSPQMTQ